MAYSVGVISLGCNKNRVDTETALGLLQEDGFTFTEDPAQADIFPTEDYPLCVAHDRFNFVLRVCRDEEGRLMIRRADPLEWIERT